MPTSEVRGSKVSITLSLFGLYHPPPVCGLPLSSLNILKVGSPEQTSLYPSIPASGNLLTFKLMNDVSLHRSLTP